jgi:ligand-binding sensor domain-containing protein
VRNGLTHGYLSAIAEDAGGNVWLSTTNAGVMKLARDGFITYGRQDGIEDIGAVFADAAGNLCVRGHVLSGALERFYRGSTLAWLKKNPEAVHLRMGCMNGDGITWFHPRALANLGWATRAVTLQGRTGAWWLGTAEGLAHYPPTVRLSSLETATPLRVYTTGDGLASNQVYGLFEDSRGDVWVSTIARETNGLARWDHESGRLQNLAKSSGLPPLVSELPRSFGEDRSGAVWIGFSGSIARYSSGQFRLFGSAEGVPAGNINDIHVDRSHRLWLASSQSGLVRVDNANSARPVFVRYGADRLSSPDLETIAEDAEGHLYVGGGHGIDRVDPQTGRVKHFTVADGLTQGIVTSGHRDRAGALWFGLTTGLTRMIPAPDRPSPAPRAWITGLRVSGIPHLVSARGEQHLSLATLGPEQNQMQIDFVGIGFRTGEVMRYQYRLEGADTDWSPLTDQRSGDLCGTGASPLRVHGPFDQLRRSRQRAAGFDQLSDPAAVLAPLVVHGADGVGDGRPRARFLPPARRAVARNGQPPHPHCRRPAR